MTNELKLLTEVLILTKYKSIITTYTALANENILADTSSAAFSITLPIAAVAGDVIHIIDSDGTFATNNLTVARNGHSIRGVASDLTLNVNWADVELVYVDASIGWRY